MKKYGLLGYPLKHSFSQKYFTQKFSKEHIEAAYLNFEIEDIADICKIIRENLELVGLNVTLPHKETVMKYLTDLDEEAKNIGAVNVIKIKRVSDNKTYLKGYNTDIIGFTKPLKVFLNDDIHKKALILGTGGASKAVYHGLVKLGIDPVFVSRSPKQGAFTYQDLNKEIMHEHTIIVNTTPLGTFPDVDKSPDIPYEYITSRHLLYDLVYNPAETKFLKLGKERGAKIKNGADMLEIQALEAWKIWNEL